MTRQEILKSNVIFSNNDNYDESYNKVNNYLNSNAFHSKKVSQKEIYKQSKKNKENQLRKIEIPEFGMVETIKKSYPNISTCKSNYLSLQKLLQENELFL